MLLMAVSEVVVTETVTFEKHMTLTRRPFQRQSISMLNLLQSCRIKPRAHARRASALLLS